MPSEAKWTPGPWRLFSSGTVMEVFDLAGRVVVKWTGFDSAEHPHKTKLANARLIASAPDLHAALRGLVAGVERAASAGIDLTGHVGIGAALAALAKAEGR